MKHKTIGRIHEQPSVARTVDFVNSLQLRGRWAAVAVKFGGYAVVICRGSMGRGCAVKGGRRGSSSGGETKDQAVEGMAEEGGKDVVVMWRGFRGVIVEMNTGDGDQSSDLEEVAESRRLGIVGRICCL
ncbi:hypothetical protein Droror1_Dr00000413 [Drosera rotundifolia]